LGQIERNLRLKVEINNIPFMRGTQLALIKRLVYFARSFL
jgi:hypothetical protein